MVVILSPISVVIGHTTFNIVKHHNIVQNPLYSNRRFLYTDGDWGKCEIKVVVPGVD
jgi:hypothetical protein